MNPIGGYFELELRCGGPLIHPRAYPVNSGRAGLEIIVKRRAYRHLYVPEYICPVVLDLLKARGVAYTAYEVNDELEVAVLPPKMREHEGFLYIDYFGVKDAYCRRLAKAINPLILDLTQAFFFVPPAGTDAFNSARKFLGVPDGGFVYGGFVSDLNLTADISWPRCEHLLRRLDGDVAGGYEAFKKNDAAMEEWTPRRMSLLTQQLIRNSRMRRIREQRVTNYAFLDRYLKDRNKIRLSLKQGVPLCYPFWADAGVELRRRLIENKIFVPTYWPRIEDYFRVSERVFEWRDHLLCLPVDQRYSVQDMERIVRMITVK